MENGKGALSLTAGFMLAGSSVVAARFVSASLGIFTIAAVSLLFASICLFSVCGRRLWPYVKAMKRKEWILLILQALFGIFLFRLFLLLGLTRTSTSEAGILTGATPVITSLLAVVLLKEKMQGMRIAGLFMTIAGIMLLQGLLLQRAGFDASHFFGNMLVLFAAGSESIFNILSRSTFAEAAVAGHQADPLQQTALVTFTAFLLCLVPAVFEAPVPHLQMLDLGQWLALVWYGVFVTALAYFLWYAGIKRCEASVAAVFSGMMPFTALLLSVLLLGERPALLQYAGGVLVTAGMVISGLKRNAPEIYADI